MLSKRQSKVTEKIGNGKNNSDWGIIRNNDLDFECHYSYSQKKNQRVFMASEIGAQLGHSNIRKAIRDCGLIEGKDYVVLKEAQFPKFFDFVRNQKLLSNKAHTVTILYETGVDLLTIGSKLEKGKMLRRWMVDEVLPALREKGYYTPASRTFDALKMQEHFIPEIQKEHSKIVNRTNYEKGGVEKIIEYNTKSCVLFTGELPSEIKRKAKERGMPSKYRSSAKEVLRHDKPEVACAMSFTDDIVAQGVELEQVVGVAKKFALPLFRQVLEWGIIPGELKEAS